MARYVITAEIGVHVEVAIEADSREDAEAKFSENMAVKFMLPGLPYNSFEVHDDYISDSEIEDVVKER